MKNIITALLSIFITLILIVLGLSISAKNLITETATIIIQEEVTNKIIENTDIFKHTHKHTLTHTQTYTSSPTLVVENNIVDSKSPLLINIKHMVKPY